MTITKKQIPTDLTLEIGDDQSPERFMAAARAFFGYVLEVGRMVAPEGVTPQWVVRVREGSNLLAVDPAPNAIAEVTERIYVRAERGVRDLAAGELEDSGLSEAALAHLRNLAELGEENGQPASPARIWVKRKPVEVPWQIARTIRDDWRADYHDFGTIEGKLEGILDKNGTLVLQVKRSRGSHHCPLLFQRGDADRRVRRLPQARRGFRHHSLSKEWEASQHRR